MIVTIQSFIPWLQNLNGQYEIQNEITVSHFLDQLGIEWDRDVLVGINQRIAKPDDILSDRDEITLLIPLSGG